MRPRRSKRMRLGDLDRDSRSRFPPWECVRLFVLNANGVTVKMLSTHYRASESWIYKKIALGRDLWALERVPRLEILTAHPLRPNECDHVGAIEVGRPVVCVVCMASGYDDVDALTRLPAIALDVKPNIDHLRAETGAQKRKKK
jgi:hypothetical protein